MQSLKKRIATLESRRCSDLEALTHEELKALSAAIAERIRSDMAAQPANSLEVHHAKR